MPDSHNGGDILLVKKNRTIEVTIERGMRGWDGCTRAAKFEIAYEDAYEFAQGLMQTVLDSKGDT